MNKLSKVTIIKVLRPILTILIYAIAVLLVAVSVELTFGRSTSTWVIIIITIILSISTNAVWSPSGVEKAEKTQKVFNTSLKYHTYANYIISNQLFDELRDFCKWRNEEFEKELLTHKMGEFLLKYDELMTYIELKKKALQTAKIKPNGKVEAYTDQEFLDFRAKFNKKQQLVLEYYSEHQIKFARITSDDLTKGHKTRGSLKPVNTEKIKRGSRYVTKIIWGIGLGVLSVGAIFYMKEDFGMNEVIQIVMWLFSIVMNVFTSYWSGYQSVINNRYDFLKDKNERCAEFFKYANIEMSKVEEGMQLIKEDIK